MSKTLSSTGKFFDMISISYFLFIRWEILWKGRYLFVFGSNPTASESRINEFPLTLFFTYSTTSGNCFVTFSRRLVNSLIPSSFLWIWSLKPSNLYSISAGFPTLSKPSFISLTFKASITFTGLPGSRLTFLKPLIPSIFAFSATIEKSFATS